MSTASFSCTVLAGTNKAGIIKPDDNGYYTQVLGAFDFLNSAGANYPFESAKSLFESSSSLMRRIKNGQCYGENGHPKKTPGMSMRDYITRILQVDEGNIICHFANLWIDKDNVKDENGKPIIAVMGRVKPAGPHAASLEASMKNPEENVAFSVRSLTQDTFANGRTQKHMRTLVTYDRVPEPGISCAAKYNNPALEMLEESEDLITPEMLNLVEQEASSKIALESGGMSIAMVRSELGWTAVEKITPASALW